MRIEKSTIKRTTAVSPFDFIYNCAKQLRSAKKKKKTAKKKKKRTEQNSFLFPSLFDLQNFECKHKECVGPNESQMCIVCGVCFYSQPRVMSEINSFLYFHYLLLGGCFFSLHQFLIIFMLNLAWRLHCPRVWFTEFPLNALSFLRLICNLLNWSMRRGSILLKNIAIAPGFQGISIHFMSKSSLQLDH